MMTSTQPKRKPSHWTGNHVELDLAHLRDIEERGPLMAPQQAGFDERAIGDRGPTA